MVAESHAPAAARRACDELGEGLGSGTRARLGLLVSELVTNAVRHGASRSTDAVLLEARLSPSTLRVEVADRGPGFTPSLPRPGERDAEGWGLFLVDALSDRWGLTDARTTRVWFELDLSRTEG